DGVALLTEWDEFRWVDFERIAAVMRRPSIVDARNLLDPAAMRRRGFDYVAVGRRGRGRGRSGSGRCSRGGGGLRVAPPAPPRPPGGRAWRRRPTPPRAPPRHPPTPPPHERP